MGLLEHNREILQRMQDLRPIETQLRRIFMDGKREHLTRGVDAQGRSFTPLKPSTREQRRGGGPPLAPQGPNADIITKYMVTIQQATNGLVIAAGWPMRWVKYHVDGGRKLPKRDPTGFRPEDKKEAMKTMRAWVMRGRQ